MQTVTVGPFLFAVGTLAILLGIIVAYSVAGFCKHRGQADAGRALWWLLIITLLAARVGWIIQWRAMYMASPLSMLDIRDGGFSWLVGLSALLLCTGIHIWRTPRVRLAVTASVASGVAAWGLASLVALQLGAAMQPSLPDLTLRTATGDAVRLSSFAGKPMVINLWATWCGPCRREMPMLVKASRQLEEVTFVFADQGESAAVVNAWLETENLAPEYVLMDPASDLSRHYNAQGYPTTLFVDAQGRLQDSRVGELSRASLDIHLKHILPSR